MKILKLEKKIKTLLCEAVDTASHRPVELGYNVMKGTVYFFVVINERCYNRGVWLTVRN